jgi:hypothetical protein
MSFASRPQVHESNETIDSSYPIDADVEYRLIERASMVAAGTGRTKTMSSSQVVLESQQSLPVGMLVELAVTWPVWLQSTVRLKLHIFGRTTRIAGNFTVIDILRHEFRTVAPQGSSDAGEAKRRPASTASTACAPSQPKDGPSSAIGKAAGARSSR